MCHRLSPVHCLCIRIKTPSLKVKWWCGKYSRMSCAFRERSSTKPSTAKGPKSNVRESQQFMFQMRNDFSKPSDLHLIPSFDQKDDDSILDLYFLLLLYVYFCSCLLQNKIEKINKCHLRKLRLKICFCLCLSVNFALVFGVIIRDGKRFVIQWQTRRLKGLLLCLCGSFN